MIDFPRSAASRSAQHPGELPASMTPIAVLFPGLKRRQSGKTFIISTQIQQQFQPTRPQPNRKRDFGLCYGRVTPFVGARDIGSQLEG